MISIPAGILIVILLIAAPIYLFVAYRSLRRDNEALKADITSTRNALNSLRSTVAGLSKDVESVEHGIRRLDAQVVTIWDAMPGARGHGAEKRAEEHGKSDEPHGKSEESHGKSDESHGKSKNK